MSAAGERDLPEPRVTRRGSVSLAWAIPVLALAIAAAVAWRHYAGLGPTVEIALEAGGGVEAGSTPVRFRGVEIGVVEEVRLGEDLQSVVAVARLDPTVEDRLTDSATFWLVRPVLSADQVAGLETLVSGVYLGVAFGEGGERTRRFEALGAPPITDPNAPGRRLTLRADSGAALSAGSPVYFKAIEVGRVESRRLADDARSVLFDVFVNAPYDRRITPETRFWDVSGLNVEFGAGGVSVNVSSLAALARGGVAFDAVGEASAVPEGAVRTLYASREAAEGSVYDAGDETPLRYSILFERSVRGLQAGAPVEYRGVQIGEVESLSIEAGETVDQTRIAANLLLQPRRLGLQDSDLASQRAFFDRSVERGLRARLAAGSLITGALYVELVDIADAPLAEVDYSREIPRLPAAPRQLDEIREQVDSLIARAQDLPVEELVGQAIEALSAITVLASDPALTRAPAELEGALSAARGLVDDLAEANAAQELAGALRSAGSAASAIEAASADLPGLAARMNRLAAALEETAKAYGAGSTLNSEAVAALREVRQAARSISTLAQALERRPNSLILGR